MQTSKVNILIILNILIIMANLVDNKQAALQNISVSNVDLIDAVINVELSASNDKLKAITGLSRENFGKILGTEFTDKLFIETVSKLGSNDVVFPVEIYRKRFTGKSFITEHSRIKKGSYATKLDGNILIFESLDGNGVQILQLKRQIKGEIGSYIKGLGIEIDVITAVERRKLSMSIRTKFEAMRIESIDTIIAETTPKVIEHKRARTAIKKGYYMEKITSNIDAQIAELQQRKAKLESNAQ